jgi:hypothetical protein
MLVSLGSLVTVAVASDIFVLSIVAMLVSLGSLVTVAVASDIFVLTIVTTDRNES